MTKSHNENKENSLVSHVVPAPRQSVHQGVHRESLMEERQTPLDFHFLYE